MPKFRRSIEIKAPLEQVFEFHLHPANVVLIAPPVSKTTLLATTDPVLKVGSRVTVRSIQAGLHVRMEAEVVALERARLLKDTQVYGPFRSWTHTHTFEPIEGGTRLTDHVEYALPLGLLGGLAMGRTVAREIEAVFTYRQERTRLLLEGSHPPSVPG